MAKTRNTRSTKSKKSVQAKAPVAIAEPAPALTPALALAPAPAPEPPVAVTHEAIARRAFEIYLSRAGRPGNPLDDWFAAERELTTRAA